MLGECELALYNGRNPRHPTVLTVCITKGMLHYISVTMGCSESKAAKDSPAVLLHKLKIKTHRGLASSKRACCITSV